MIESALIGLAVMGIQLGFIDTIIKRRNRIKEQRLWTPFRILFFQAICDHHYQLMELYKELVECINTKLSEIRNKGQVQLSDIKMINNQVIEFQERLSDSDKTFHNVIQTVSASLQPEAAEYCNESLYFSFILSKYLNKIKVICIEMQKIKDLSNNNHTSHPLNGIDAKKMSLEMIVETRLAKFIEQFSNSIWKTERLYYYNGEIMEERDYRSALRTDKSIRELDKIPRTLPIKNFFETDEDYRKRTEKH